MSWDDIAPAVLMVQIGDNQVKMKRVQRIVSCTAKKSTLFRQRTKPLGSHMCG
jgi:hypothetical protein